MVLTDRKVDFVPENVIIYNQFRQACPAVNPPAAPLFSSILIEILELPIYVRYGAYTKIFTNPSRNTAVSTPWCYLPRDFDRCHTHTAKYLFYHGEPSALLEHLTNNDVADLQRRRNIGGVDVPQFLAQIAVAPFRAPTGRTAHYLRYPLYLIGDCGA